MTVCPTCTPSCSPLLSTTICLSKLVSSGLGGRIPAGYRVGRIAHIKDEQADNFRSIEITPAANFIDNAYVLILQDKMLNKNKTVVGQ